jgi:hypothetical protein
MAGAQIVTPTPPSPRQSRASVHRPVPAGQAHEPVPVDGGFARDGLFGLGDLGVDAVQAAAGAVGAVAVVGDLVPPAVGLLLLRGRPGLGEDVPVGNVQDLAVGVAVGLAPGENARRNTRCGGYGSELRCRGPRESP